MTNISSISDSVGQINVATGDTDDITESTICGQAYLGIGMGLGEAKIVTCGLKGRTVFIQVNGYGSLSLLCRVMVYGK